MASNGTGLPPFPNPFTHKTGLGYANRINWLNITPAADVWSLIPSQVKQPGFGCFQSPYQPYGFPLLNTTKVVDPAGACSKGFYCPYLDPTNPATYPVYCPPLDWCFYLRGNGINCAHPQGVFEPIACPKGYFCRSYNQIDICPAGSYCLAGSSAPTPCEFLSICKAKAVIQDHYGLLLIVGVADILLVVVYAILRFREFRLTNPGKPLFVTKKLEVEISAEESTRLVRKTNLSVGDIQKNIQTLTAGFHKGLDGHTNLSMNYEFDNLGLRLPDDKEILKGVSGTIQAGRMTAIMGPSGAGKTTFMNVLMGKATRTSGSLKINGAIAEMQQYRKIIGYVPQDDVMIEELTVRENIRYAARTRLPDSWSNGDVDSHVDAILTALNLNHVAHSRVGNTLVRGISGGQRKRVNIGMELAAAPLSVFLDEPTSGLDSTAALDVTNILHSISRLGLTVVAVIHQPRVEIFETFDDVLMVAPGGLTAYFGPIAGAQAYFESIGFSFRSNANVADTLMDILSGRGELQEGIPTTRAGLNEILSQWTVHAESHDIPSAQQNESGPSSVTAGAKESSIESMKNVAKKRGASFLRQVGLSHNRFVVQQHRLAAAFFLEVLVGLAAGGIMGVASGGAEFTGRYIYPYTSLSPSPRYWYTSLYGMLVGIVIALASAPAAVKVFSEETAVYLREAEAGHNSAAYFVGKNLGSIYRIVLASAHFVGLYVYLAQPPIGIGYQYALVFLNFFGVYGLGMILSMMVRRENAPLIAVTVSMISEVLCGFGPSIPDATTSGYMERGGSIRFVGRPYGDTIDLMDVGDTWGYEFGHTTRNMLIMVALGFAYRVVAFALFYAALKSSFFKRMWAQLKMAVTRKGKTVDA
ncbi:hypothetical protein BC830DRAFT_1220204 [Chytriomyces sp. MP71]|nr:hypothetical protein BC830DRAFT_1220204 [Chytriomyces sp. MP71]